MSKEKLELAGELDRMAGSRSDRSAKVMADAAAALRASAVAEPVAPAAAPTREEIIEQCISIVREMTVKHGSPVGDAYSNGVHDQGARIEGKLIALKAAPAK